MQSVKFAANITFISWLKTKILEELDNHIL